MDTFTDKIDTMLEAVGEIKPGSMINLKVKHDPGCPALVSHSMADCTCTPTIERMEDGGNDRA